MMTTVFLFLASVLYCGIFLYAIGWAIGVFLGDYGSLFFRPKSPLPPADWSALEQQTIPRASEQAIEHQKARLRESCELHGNYVQRNSAYSLSAHPLKLDE